MEVGVQGHAPAALLPGKTRYPLFRRLGGPYGRSERVKKISPTTGFDPRIVFYVVSRYTDWAIAANKWIYIYTHIYIYIYIYIYIQIPTLISGKGPVSVYTTVNEPIQQHTAVRFNSRLRWTTTKPLAPSNCHTFISIPSVAKYSLSPVATVWMYFVCVEGVGRGWEGLIFVQ